MKRIFACVLAATVSSTALAATNPVTVPSKLDPKWQSKTRALLEQVALLGGVGPHSRVTVGLELHRDRVPLRPEEALHVVTDLVGDHVGLREVAGGTELGIERPEER